MVRSTINHQKNQTVRIGGRDYNPTNKLESNNQKPEFTHSGASEIQLSPVESSDLSVVNIPWFNWGFNHPTWCNGYYNGYNPVQLIPAL